MEIVGQLTISPFHAASGHKIAVLAKNTICRIFAPIDTPHFLPAVARPAGQKIPRDTPHPDREKRILNKI